MSSQLFEDSFNKINIVCFFDIDQNIILVYNDNNMQFFDQDFVDIALQAD